MTTWLSAEEVGELTDGRAMVCLPRIGRVVHHRLFAGGCRARVTKVLPPKAGMRPGGNRGWRVVVRITADDGHKVENRGRCWSIATWDDFVATAKQRPEHMVER